MKNPTLADVARVAGVSPTTVSRVLNNRGYLSEATRKAVAQAMRDLDYTPNALARSLRDSRTHLVGVIFPSVAHPFYGHMATELEVQLSRRGFRVLLCNSEGQESTERAYLSMLIANQVDGIVTGAHSDAVATTPNLRAPLVTIDRPGVGMYPNVSVDNVGASREATDGLIRRSARSIVHLTSTSQVLSPRAQGYETAMRRAGLQPRVLRVKRGAHFMESREQLTRALDDAHRSQPVDGIIAGNDSLAAHALSWARTRGLRVPEQIQVVGFDGARATRSLLPELSTVVQPYEALAHAAVRHIEDGLATWASTQGSGEAPPVQAAAGTTKPDVFDAEIVWAGTTRTLDGSHNRP